jgi:signal transduction histidine kinase
MRGLASCAYPYLRTGDHPASSAGQAFAGICAVLIATFLAIHPSVAGDFGTRDDAVAMVQRVLDKFARSGAEATFRAVNDKSDPAFHDRDLYPFIYDLKGVAVAHGARPALIGKNLISLKDQNGVYLIQEMIALAKGPGSGWVDYKWPNPITDKIEDKSSYIEKMGDYFVGVGVYRVQPDRS